MSADLYHQAIVEAARAGVGRGRLAEPDGSATVDNPLCGDRVTMDIRLGNDGALAAVGHVVRGCLLCEAAASLIARHAPGSRPQALASVRGELREMLAAHGPPPGGPWTDLARFEPVRSYKSRHECVLLPFEALERALESLPG